MDELLTCAVCGDTSLDVKLAIVYWRDQGFEAVPRCRDRVACRNRVALAGKTWPLISGGTRRKP